MNYLAHLILAYPNHAFMVGNFIADHQKSKSAVVLPSEIRAGISMHRFIDSFIDNHPDILYIKQLFYPEVGKFAGVLIDMIFDHFLAADWDRWHGSTISLQNFAQFVYQLMHKNKHFLPPSSLYMLQYMEKQDWLYNYRQLEGLSMALSGLTKRIDNKVNLNKGLSVLEMHKNTLEKTFNSFYPELRSNLETKHFFIY